MSLPLAGLKVLAFEQYGAGPFGSQYLSDLGAEVIKIEPAGTDGDYLRALGPYFIDEERNSASSIFFQALNRNCLLYTSPSPRDVEESRMPSSA